MKLKRTCTGRYETQDGKYEVVSIELFTNGERTEKGWHLFFAARFDAGFEGDGYCNTFNALWEVREALEDAKEDETY